MLRFIVRRLLLVVPILFRLSILVFFWVRALPGSPAESLLGERSTPALVAEYEERFGLDESRAFDVLKRPLIAVSILCSWPSFGVV